MSIPRKRDRFLDLVRRQRRDDGNRSSATASMPMPAMQTATAAPPSRLPSFEDRVFEKLSDEDCRLIRKHTPDKQHIAAIVKEALTHAQEKQDLCQTRRWTYTFRGREIPLQEQADKVVEWLDHFKQVGDIAANADPIHVGLPWAGIRLLLQVAVAEKQRMAALLSGLETTFYLSKRLEAYLCFLQELPPTLELETFETGLVEFNVRILQFMAFAIRSYQQSKMARGMQSFWQPDAVGRFDADCSQMASRADQDASNCYRRFQMTEQTVAKQRHQELLERLKQLETTHVIQTRIEVKLDLIRLPLASGAAFESYAPDNDGLDAQCHPHTREDLRHDIYQWAAADDGKCIFWLKGMAGTGKSTISRTVAQHFLQTDQLGASFFFKRGERDRGNGRLFVTTLIFGLCCRIPKLRTYVSQALDKLPDPAMNLRDQFEVLFFAPLVQATITASKRYFLVIDALDECDRRDAHTILAQLSRLQEFGLSSIRVFITSRSEPLIRQGFKKMREEIYHDIALHEVLPHSIRHDISVYLEAEFARIREGHRLESPTILDANWPGSQQLEELTDRAIPLFIAAATICRFVGDINADPQRRLQQILDQPIGTRSTIEQTYLPVLQPILDSADEQRSETPCQEFRTIIGALILLVEPLSASELTTLLGIHASDLHHQLRFLHSVLSVPSDDHLPIRPLHLSFSEFLINPKSSLDQRLLVNERDTHAYLADQCLGILLSPKGLRRDICSLVHPGISRSKIEDSKIQAHIPPPLQYACRYWALHVDKSARKIHDDGQEYKFLQKHLLHWLECLSLLDDVPRGIDAIVALLSRVETPKSRVSAFLEDCRRFVLYFSSAIVEAPLQIYETGFHFSPKNSIVRRELYSQNPGYLQVLFEPPDQWSACLQTLEGHTDWITSVVFSPDGTRLASGSDDSTVRLWNTQTGECQGVLEGHTSWIRSVVFSPDGTRLASGSNDSTVRLWNTQTGECQGVLEDYTGPVTSVVFSPEAEHNSLIDEESHLEYLWTSEKWLGQLSERILWLPPDYRGSHTAFLNGTLAIGSDSGRVILVRSIN